VTQGPAHCPDALLLGTAPSVLRWMGLTARGGAPIACGECRVAKPDVVGYCQDQLEQAKPNESPRGVRRRRPRPRHPLRHDGVYNRSTQAAV
jgi:hypothetical protein